MANATLAAIQDKVRRLTRSPSTNQLSIANLNEYINTFIAYDLPEELRLFKLHSVANFQLNAYQDRYDLTQLTTPLPDGSGNNETLNNFFITINSPVYIDGYKAFYSQSRDEFYTVYPKNQQLVRMGSGNGATTNFTKRISNGFILANDVVVTAIGPNNSTLYMSDDGAGIFTGNGVGTVDYVTGDIDVTFTNPPGPNKPVYAHVVQYTPGRPAALLYYGDEFIVRPVPDQPYTMNFEFYVEPTQLINNGDVPQLKQWWQYIAYGAAKKVLEDRMDMETVQMIMPEFKKQERLALRRTLVQRSTQRVATIYSEQAGLNSAFSNFYTGF